MGHRQRKSIASLEGQTVVNLHNRLLRVAMGDHPPKDRHAQHRIRWQSPKNIPKSFHSLDVLEGMKSILLLKKKSRSLSAYVLLKGLTDICFCFCVHSLLTHSHLEAQIEVALRPTVWQAETDWVTYILQDAWSTGVYLCQLINIALFKSEKSNLKSSKRNRSNWP